MKKKKLAIFVNTLARAGAEKVVFLLMKEFRNEFEIHLLVFNSEMILFDVPADIKIVQIGRPNDGSKIADFLKIFLYARKVKKYLLDNGIPVMLSFLSRPNFTAGVVKMLGWKGSVVISERTMTSEYYSSKTMSGKIGRLLVSVLYKKANLIIANSKLNEEDLKKTFGIKGKIITVYNPIDINEVKEARKEDAAEMIKNPDDFIFCNIGRYDYYKNHQLLLTAFAQLNNTRAKLVIIGKNVPQKLAPLREKLKLENSVQLIDVRQNIFPFLLSANAFVLSSIIEGFPNVLLEALASSLPVISTDCKSGPREILAPGTLYPGEFNTTEEAQFGLLVKNNDADMLAAAMDKMLTTPELCKKYTERAFARAQHFDIAIIVKEFRAALNGFYSADKASA
jgi:N-acetylgalactosamine-N,N'-diacetylbacillosaminyl-diphospho-undecaprenol 4-alpha-N-acetylgalactosaminyltransferase